MKLTPARRRWLYRITAAALGVAAVYGVLDGTKIAALLVLVAAVLGVADRNVNQED